MKLHYHPASTTSRPILLFAAENGIRLDTCVVDLFAGEHLAAPYAALNPNRLVPMLEDGEFRLTESSAILKYLAEDIGSPAYPRAPQARARVNERMDWFNTQFARDFAYGFVYPQIFPGHRREQPVVQRATLHWHRERARHWLQVLDRDLIGPERDYVCGNSLTIADFQGSALAALGEVARMDYTPYPHLRRWLRRMKSLEHWSAVNAAIDGYSATLASASFEPLATMEAG